MAGVRLGQCGKLSNAVICTPQPLHLGEPIAHPCPPDAATCWVVNWHAAFSSRFRRVALLRWH